MRTRTLATGVIATGLALLAGACGSGDDGSASSDAGGGARRIDVAMVDIDFEPETLTIARRAAARRVRFMALSPFRRRPGRDGAGRGGGGAGR